MRGSLAIAVAASLWGLWSLFFKSAERLAVGTTLSARTESFAIMVVMAVVLLPPALRDRRRAQRRSARSWLGVVCIGACDALNILCFLTAMQLTTVAIAVLTHYLAPLLVAAAAPVVLGERWRARTAVALVAGLVGLCLLLQPWSATWSSDGAAHHAQGAALGALSAVFFAASVLIQKNLVARFTSWELGAFPKPASLAVLALALPGVGALAVGTTSWAVLVAGGLLCGALPCVLFFVGLRTTGASRASVLTLCEPLVAVLVGALVWREPLGVVGAVGALVILGAAAAIARSAPTEPSASL